MQLHRTADLTTLGTILGIWAHPDDESWCMGALMAGALENGQRVVCVTATHGEAGQTSDETKYPQAKLQAIRSQEIQNALQKLGGGEHMWLDYQDGKLAAVETDEAAAILANIIEDVQPDTIITFGPDGITGHPDHQTMYYWTLEAIRLSQTKARLFTRIESDELYRAYGKTANEAFNIYFMTDVPKTIRNADADLCFCPSKKIAAKKEASIKAHVSQSAALFKTQLGKNFVAKACECETFIEAIRT